MQTMGRQGREEGGVGEASGGGEGGGGANGKGQNLHRNICKRKTLVEGVCSRCSDGASGSR